MSDVESVEDDAAAESAEAGPVPPGAPPDGSLAPDGEPSPAGHPPAPAAEAIDDVGFDLDASQERVEQERDEYLDALRRLQADFENYKKRMVRQQTELLDRAGETLVEKLLPVLDAIDLARQHGAGEGVEQIATALVEALVKEGLERVDPVGEAFDPNEHDAVAHEPGEGDGDGGQVVATLMRAGYRWKGRLLRPAMVSVRG